MAADRTSVKGITLTQTMIGAGVLGLAVAFAVPYLLRAATEGMGTTDAGVIESFQTVTGDPSALLAGSGAQQVVETAAAVQNAQEQNLTVTAELAQAGTNGAVQAAAEFVGQEFVGVKTLEHEGAVTLPPERIAELVRDLDSDTFSVRQPAYEALQAALAQRNYEDAAAVLEAIANALPENPRLETVRRLNLLIATLDVEVARRLALDSRKEVLSMLARYGPADAQMLENIASNRKTSAADLSFLAHVNGQSENVLMAVAANPNTAASDLSFLARVEGQTIGVLRGVAWNKNTPAADLSFLARVEGQNVDVLLEIARNPNTPTADLSFLAHRSYNHLGTPVLLEVARNPNTPLEDLQFLAGHPNELVSEAAQTSLNSRSSLP